MIDSEITFRKLEIFLAYMEKQNIARSAEQLGLSPVSVHRALHSLEEGLRCPLFVHKGRNLLPMDSATVLADYSRNILELMERGIQATRASAGFGQMSLRLGCLYSLMLQTVPTIMSNMKARRPNTEIKLIMGSNQELLTKLDEQQLDAVLIHQPRSTFDHQRYESLPLLEDEIFLAAPINSALSPDESVDLRNLKHESFVALTEGFGSYYELQECFRIAGFEPKIAVQVHDIFSMLSLVQAGVGYALIPGRMRKVYENNVRLLPLNQEYRAKQKIILAFLRNREHDPNLLALTAECRMYARTMAQQ
ncbi:LysR family transcriptional regulator [Zophobihabitans entericus]|uniref:LysR family transcriptional regulator n=1 Tax=Zophobihabitans entericus TaxID=1635327 RepID=A0A6G9I8I8_9GAMM|nr:LysR family transcriptional regulator [Zophobihabitans entericus]QIQ20526.1 LysR family transcriptional regulator [Zophobihabitans entericus]